MNYDGSQQYGFNLGLATATAGSQQQATATQNVAGSLYPYAFHGTGDLQQQQHQQQQLSAKLASVPVQAQLPAMAATMAGKNIIYSPQQHPLQQHQLQQHQHQFQQQQQLQLQQQHLQQQQLQQQLQQQQLQQQHQLQQQQQLQNQQQQVGTLSMVPAGPAMVSRQGVFPMATAAISMSQEQLCSPQAMVDVYGNLSPNMKVPTSASATPAYKSFTTNWMSLPQQAINNNATNITNAITTSISTNTNQPQQQAALPSIGHLWSHFQQQKQQTAMTTFIQTAPNQPMAAGVQPQPQSVASFQSVQVLQGSPAGLQVSPGGIHVSPGSMQVSPGSHTFQSTLSPNPAGVNFSSVRQVHVSAATLGGMMGGGVRSQHVVMAPRGQLIMAQAIPAATLGISAEVKNLQPVGKAAATVLSLATVPSSSAPPSQSSLTTSTSVSVSKSPAPALPAPAVPVKSAASIEAVCSETSPAATNTSPAALTTTTVTVTTSACSLATTTATTVHTSVPLTTTISVLPAVSTTSSCEHGKLVQTSLSPSAGSGSRSSSDAEAREESGRGSMSSASSSSSSSPLSPPTPSSTTATTSSTMSSSGGCGSGGDSSTGGGTVVTVTVPYSWRRVVENGTVLYFSPSNISLASCEEIRTYLSQNNTCKCGLECPLVVEQTFNFDPVVEGRMWRLEDVACSCDLTKLCNHKRKVLALAAFQSSTVGQDCHSKMDGPPAKCRKRDKGKLSDALLVNPLVVDSKLKTSITNAVNKHATTSANNNNNNTGSNKNAPQQQPPTTDSVSDMLNLAELKQEPGKAVAAHLTLGLPPTPSHTPTSTTPADGSSSSGSHHYPSPSPVTHSPASIRSTPVGSVVGAGGDGTETPLSLPQFASKVEFGGRGGFLGGGGGVRMGGLNPNHVVDPRHFVAAGVGGGGGVQCSVLSQEDLKPSYFMQQQQQQQQQQQLHLGPHSQQGMGFGSSPSRPSMNHMGVQPQFPLGYPHNNPHHPQYPGAYPNAMVYMQGGGGGGGHPGHPNHPHPPHPNNPSILHPHHHQQQPPSHHPLFQNMRMNSQQQQQQPMWPPQAQPHHSPGFPQEGGMYPGMFSQAEPMWLDAGKPKSKRPRSKKDKQKLNSIVDRTSPCEGAGGKVKVLPPGGGGSASVPVVSKCVIPSTLSLSSTITTSSTAPTSSSTSPAVFSPLSAAASSMPCSVSFLENPAVFVAQQTAIINNSLASCNIDLNSPTTTAASTTGLPAIPNSAVMAPSLCPKLSPSQDLSAPPIVPLIKVEQDCGDLATSAALSVRVSDIECKKEPGLELSPTHLLDGNTALLSPRTPHSCTDESPTAAKVMCGCGVVSGTNHNNNKLIVRKTEFGEQLSPKGPGCMSECRCSGGGAVGLTPAQASPQHQQVKKKTSPRVKNRTKSVSAGVAAKVNSVVSNNPPCSPECVSSSPYPQHAQLAVVDPCSAQMPVLGAAPATAMQIPDLSQVLVGGGGGAGASNNNCNLLALQQALAQYSVPGNANASLGMGGGGSGGNGNATPDFPASSLLTAAARAQLSQQVPMGPFLFPAVLQANGMTGQDVSFMATAAMQQQLQQQQQQFQLQQQQQVDTSVPVHSSAELNAKNAAAMMAAGLVGVNNISSINQPGAVPFQLIPNGNMMTTGMLPGAGTAQFQNGTVFASGVPQLQSLPLNILLPVSQQLVGIGPEPMQGISVDLSGNLVANVNLGANNKAFNVSPKVFTSVVDSSVAMASPGGCSSQAGSFSPQQQQQQQIQPPPPPSQGNAMKATGSTVHHLPQHSISGNAGQPIGPGLGHHGFNQTFPHHTLNPGLASALNPTLTHGLEVAGGDTVMLNNLLPSILAFNAPMPPISLPVVTNVTNSLTQVIPAVGTPALVTQQQQQQQQQQAAAAQFLNALALPAVAAATFATNPLLITSPLASSQLPTAAAIAKSVGGDQISEDKLHNASGQEELCQDGGAGVNYEKENAEVESVQKGEEMEGDCCGAEKDGGDTNAGTLEDAQQQQHQQVFVLPGGGMPLMQVLGGNATLQSAPVVDKLCNSTQLFLPAAAAPQAAQQTASGATTAPPVPDLSQLGPIALTPLGIQQMWNSLNSLQLQQLQTLQLQQLVWQQLQGCIPHQVTTLDPNTAQATQFFTHLQQQQQNHQQQHTNATPSQPPDPQHQASDIAQQQHDDDGVGDAHQEADAQKNGFEAAEQATLSSPDSGKDTTDTQIEDINPDSIREEQASPITTMSADPAMPTTAAKVIACGSTPRVQTVQPMVLSEPTSSKMTAVPSREKLPSSDSLKTRLASAKAAAAAQQEQASRGEGGNSNHLALRSSAVNGESSAQDLHERTTAVSSGTGSRRRVVRRGIEARCSASAPGKALANGPSAVALAGVGMSSPTKKLVGQGPVRT